MAIKNKRAFTDAIGFKVGVYANIEDPDVWIEFDPEDIMELMAVQSSGCNRIILTLERGVRHAPIWEDCDEFFDVHVTMCTSTDFLAAIQRLKEIKEQRLARLQKPGTASAHLTYGLDEN